MSYQERYLQRVFLVNVIPMQCINLLYKTLIVKYPFDAGFLFSSYDTFELLFIEENQWRNLEGQSIF